MILSLPFHVVRQPDRPREDVGHFRFLSSFLLFRRWKFYGGGGGGGAEMMMMMMMMMMMLMIDDDDVDD